MLVPMTTPITPGARTRLAAVIGAPVAHSLSPALHNAAFAAIGLDAVYVALHVEPADLAAAVAGFRAVGILGVSVTVPHKHAVAAFCDQLAGPAERIGAVNCLVFERTGGSLRVIGHNTDAGGFVDSLVGELGMDPAGARVLLLGAGGAARAVHAGLCDAGAAQVDVVARTPAQASWVHAEPWTEGALAALCRDADLVVDCTSAALSPEREAAMPAAVPVELLPAHAAVASLVYHRQPALLAAAQARGLRTLGGAGMLVHQGARAFGLWTARDAPIAVMWAAMHAALAQRA